MSTIISKTQNRNVIVLQDHVFQGQMIIAFGNDRILGAFCDVFLDGQGEDGEDLIVAEKYFENSNVLKHFILSLGIPISFKAFARCMCGRDGKFDLTEGV